MVVIRSIANILKNTKGLLKHYDLADTVKEEYDLRESVMI
jgi:hypothetical protein